MKSTKNIMLMLVLLLSLGSVLSACSGTKRTGMKVHSSGAMGRPAR